jgi:hypothetical protein
MFTDVSEERTGIIFGVEEQGQFAAYLAYFSTLKVEAVCSSETSVKHLPSYVVSSRKTVLSFIYQLACVELYLHSPVRLHYTMLNQEHGQL